MYAPTKLFSYISVVGILRLVGFHNKTVSSQGPQIIFLEIHMGPSHREGDNFLAAMHFLQKLAFLSLNPAIQVNFCRKLLQLHVVPVLNKN